MKNAQLLLVACFYILINSSCAFAYGQRRCEQKDPIPRPIVTICIANELGMGQCYNPIADKTEVRSMVNHVCFSVSDYMMTENWIKQIGN